MRVPVRYRRTSRKQDPNVREFYPSESGGRRARDRTIGKASSEDAEPRAIRCFQCGQPIEDYAEINTCPFCESDNMQGRRL